MHGFFRNQIFKLLVMSVHISCMKMKFGLLLLVEYIRWVPASGLKDCASGSKLSSCIKALSNGSLVPVMPLTCKMSPSVAQHFRPPILLPWDYSTIDRACLQEHLVLPRVPYLWGKHCVGLYSLCYWVGDFRVEDIFAQEPLSWNLSATATPILNSSS